MQSSTFTFKDYAGVEIFVYKWDVDPGVTPKGIVQIAHGLAEHAGRYEHVAKRLTDEGYICYADDHRGHGKTAGDLSRAGILGPDGWDGTVRSLRNLTEYIMEEQEDKNLPIFLLGHSWGSYMTQDYIQRWGDSLNGAVLSGTNGKQPMLGILSFIAKLVSKLQGPDKPAVFLDKLAMKPLNKKFEPSETGFDWLSRDENVVKQYVEDPWCGFVVSNGFFVELAKGLKKIWDPKNEEKIPKDLPIYMFTGSEDPTNNFAEGFKALVERYRKLGIKDLTVKIYEGGRHEMLNEINKEEVINDLLDWLNSHV